MRLINAGGQVIIPVEEEEELFLKKQSYCFFLKKKYLTTHLNRIYLSTARIPFMRDKNGRENFLPDYILVRDAAQCTVMDCL